jgi:hypothetical protein
MSVEMTLKDEQCSEMLPILGPYARQQERAIKFFTVVALCPSSRMFDHL